MGLRDWFRKPKNKAGLYSLTVDHEQEEALKSLCRFYETDLKGLINRSITIMDLIRTDKLKGYDKNYLVSSNGHHERKYDLEKLS